MGFGSSFGTANLTAALQRTASTSTGGIAADNYANATFDFSAAGGNLTTASLGAVGNVNFTGTLIPFDTTYYVGGGPGTITFANSNAFSGSNGVSVASGSVVIGSSNNYTGPTLVTGGTLTIGPLGAFTGTSATSGLTVNGAAAVVNIQGSCTKTGTGYLTVEQGGVLNVNGGSVSWSGVNGVRIGLTSAGTMNINSGSVTANLPSSSGVRHRLQHRRVPQCHGGHAFVHRRNRSERR